MPTTCPHFSPPWIVVDFKTFRGQLLSALMESYTWSVSVSETVVCQGESQEEKVGVRNWAVTITQPWS